MFKFSFNKNLQVLDERIYHIDYSPETPELYYKVTGKELQPRPVGEENGVVVFNYNPISAVNYVSFKLFTILYIYFIYKFNNLFNNICLFLPFIFIYIHFFFIPIFSFSLNILKHFQKYLTKKKKLIIK